MTTQHYPRAVHYRDAEKVYDRILHLLDRLETHPWSRRMTRADQEEIHSLRVMAGSIANQLYIASHSGVPGDPTEPAAGDPHAAAPEQK